MPVVDPRFRPLLQHLRAERGLSYRQLAKRAFFSSSYLWEIEAGHKEPTVAAAVALDTALKADGALSALVTEQTQPFPHDGVRPSVPAPANDALTAYRTQLETLARQAWSAIRGADTRARTDRDRSAIGVAAEWAHLASWLYDRFVRHRPPLLRLGATRYSRRLRERAGTSPYRMEVIEQGRVPDVHCRSVTREPAPADIASGSDCRTVTASYGGRTGTSPTGNRSSSERPTSL